MQVESSYYNILKDQSIYYISQELGGDCLAIFDVFMHIDKCFDAKLIPNRLLMGEDYSSF